MFGFDLAALAPLIDLGAKVKIPPIKPDIAAPDLSEEVTKNLFANLGGFFENAGAMGVGETQETPQMQQITTPQAQTIDLSSITDRLLTPRFGQAVTNGMIPRQQPINAPGMFGQSFPFNFLSGMFRNGF